MDTKPWSVTLVLSSWGLFFGAIPFCTISLIMVASAAIGFSQLPWQFRIPLAVVAYSIIMGIVLLHPIAQSFRGRGDDDLPPKLMGVLAISDVTAMFASVKTVGFLVKCVDGPVVLALLIMAILAVPCAWLCCVARQGYDHASKYLEPCDPSVLANFRDSSSRKASPDDIIYVDMPKHKSYAHRPPHQQSVSQTTAKPVPEPPLTIAVVSSDDWHPF